MLLFVKIRKWLQLLRVGIKASFHVQEDFVSHFAAVSTLDAKLHACCQRVSLKYQICLKLLVFLYTGLDD